VIIESPDLAAMRWTLGAALADARCDIADDIKEQCRRDCITDPDEAVRRFRAVPMPRFVAVEVCIGDDEPVDGDDVTHELGGESGL